MTDSIMRAAGADASRIERELEAGRLAPDAALAELTELARAAATTALRLDACFVLGSLAGRVHGASWDLAERAAFVLLGIATESDAPQERALLLGAMGRAFRNVWLMPYVHARLADDDERVVEAAIAAAGGLSFPALEEAVASRFLEPSVAPRTRLGAIAALGRMGAESAAGRIATFIAGDAPEAMAALAALTEIRSRAGQDEALAVLARGAEPAIAVRAVRYLAEVGRAEVAAELRGLARDDDPELRLAASLAARALAAEAARDPAERILAALTESDRALRALLARRLRTLPIESVLEQAELLLSDDPEGVVQIVAEVRAPEVTRMLLALAEGDRVAVPVRARAAGSIEANEPWEREALVALARTSRDLAVRVAAIQTVGAFASAAFVVSELGALAADPAPAVRGALLWALQLSARPHAREATSAPDRARAEAIVKVLLADAEPVVRRRAAYVAGNLGAEALVGDLVALARAEPERAELRLAAFVGLSEIGSADRLADLVQLFLKEDDAAAIQALSRALERARVAGGDGTAGALTRLRDRLPKLVTAADPRTRAAAAKVAGLGPGLAPLTSMTVLAADPSPRVREQAIVALGRAFGAEADPALTKALGDGDVAIQERAAEALLARGTVAALGRVVELVSAMADEGAAARLAGRLTLPEESEIGAFISVLDGALARVGAEHEAYEVLLDLKVRALDRVRPKASTGRSVDADIAEHFPAWTRLGAVRGFAPLAKSLRTAEMLFGASGSADADQSAAIVLWSKALEGYLHAWLAPRMTALQRQPAQLWELTDTVVGSSWPAYQGWLSRVWEDPVSVGGLSVEIPLRSVRNALREWEERRLKRVDSPWSITDWSRVMLFLAIDHPAGPKNVLAIACKEPERAARLAHRLQVLAQVRNAVTHRQVAGTATLGEFRRAYYATFEELTGMA